MEALLQKVLPEIQAAEKATACDKAAVGAVMQKVVIDNTALKAVVCINLLLTDSENNAVNIVLQKNAVNKNLEKDENVPVL